MVEILGNRPKNFFYSYGTWEALDSSEWVVFDVGVFLDGSAMHSENFVVRHFLELGGGPLRVSLRCHQHFDIFEFLNF